jgi:hypothetical protein
VKLPPHVQAEVERMVAAATGMSEAGPAVTQVDTDVNGRPPRIPAIGLHPGAIDGTSPHRNRRLDLWRRT